MCHASFFFGYRKTPLVRCPNTINARSTYLSSAALLYMYNVLRPIPVRSYVAARFLQSIGLGWGLGWTLDRTGSPNG